MMLQEIIMGTRETDPIIQENSVRMTMNLNT